MDAVLENVKNTFEVRVKKALIAGPHMKSLASNLSKEKLVTKVSISSCSSFIGKHFTGLVFDL